MKAVMSETPELSQKRLFIGGLACGVTSEELDRRFSPFGTLKSLEVKVRKDEKGTPVKTFAYIDLECTDADLKKCMKTYNRTKWKGSELRIELAKENFMERLKEERKQAQKETASEQEEALKPSTGIQSKLLAISDVSTVANFQMKGAVPGTKVPGQENWVVGKYGRVLPVVTMKQNGTKKNIKFDPSKYTHNVRKIHEKKEESLETVTPDKLTWEIDAEESDVTRKRKGDFPDWKSAKSKKRFSERVASNSVELQKRLLEVMNRETAYHHSDFEVVPVNRQAKTSESDKVTKFDSDSEDEEIRKDVVDGYMDLSRFNSDSEDGVEIDIPKNIKSDTKKNTMVKSVGKSSSGVQNHSGKKYTKTSNSNLQRTCNKDIVVKHHGNVRIGITNFIDEYGTGFASGDTENTAIEEQKLSIDGENKTSDDESDFEVFVKKEITKLTEGPQVKTKHDVRKESLDKLHQQLEKELDKKGGKIVKAPKIVDGKKNLKVFQGTKFLPSASSPVSINSSAANTKNKTNSNLSDIGKVIEKGGKKREVRRSSKADEQSSKQMSVSLQTDRQTANPNNKNLIVSRHLIIDEFSSGFQSSANFPNDLDISCDLSTDESDFETFVKKETKKLELTKQKVPVCSENFEEKIDSIPSLPAQAYHSDSDSSNEELLKTASALQVKIKGIPCDSVKSDTVELKAAVLRKKLKSTEEIAKEEKMEVDSRGDASLESDDSDSLAAIDSYNEDTGSNNSEESNDDSDSQASYIADVGNEDINVGANRTDSDNDSQESNDGSDSEASDIVGVGNQGIDVGANKTDSDSDSQESDDDGSLESGDSGDESEESDDFKALVSQAVMEVKHTEKTAKNKVQKQSETKTEDVIRDKELFILPDQKNNITHKQDSKRTTLTAVKRIEENVDDDSVDNDDDREEEEENEDDDETSESDTDRKLISTEKPNSEINERSGISKKTLNMDDKTLLQNKVNEHGYKNQREQIHVPVTSGKKQNCESVDRETVSKDESDNVKENSTANKAKQMVTTDIDASIKSMAPKRMQETVQGPARKFTALKSNSKVDTDKKRLEAVKQRQKEAKAQKSTIKMALANLDKGKTVNTKIVFDSESEEEQAPVPVYKAQTASDAATQLVMEKPTSRQKSLFDSSDEDSDSEADQSRFNIREEFEGSAGRKMAKLQSRFGNDERFRMDARFIESDSGSDQEDVAVVEEDEKTKALKILQSVVGARAVGNIKPDKSKRKFKDISALKYDPSREEHQQFEVKTVPKEKPQKESKKKISEQEKTVEENAEVTVPEVSKERFFEVSESLKNTFASKAKGDNSSGVGFSLLAAFSRQDSGDDNDGRMDVSEDVAVAIPATLRTDQLSLDNRFKVTDDVDSSGSENEKNLESSDSEDENTRLNKAEKAEAKDETASKEPVKQPSTFFFLPDDHRLKEGKSFCRKGDMEKVRAEWLEKRQHFIESYKMKHKNYRRKHRGTQRPGKQRGGKHR